MTNPDPAAIRRSRSEIEGREELFGMPFTKREVAVIVANELNRHDRGLWFYKVERHIDGQRWIIARKAANFRRGYERGAVALAIGRIAA